MGTAKKKILIRKQRNVDLDVLICLKMRYILSHKRLHAHKTHTCSTEVKSCSNH